MKLRQICGIPVRIIYRPARNETEIHPRSGELLPYQRKIIAAWLDSKGFPCAGLQWSYVPVRGNCELLQYFTSTKSN